MSSEIGGSSRETLGPLMELRVEVCQSCCTCWICKEDLGEWGWVVGGEWGGRVGGKAGLIADLVLRNDAFCKSQAATCLSPSSPPPLPSPDLPGDLGRQADICVTSPALNGAADLCRWVGGRSASQQIPQKCLHVCARAVGGERSICPSSTESLSE